MTTLMFRSSAVAESKVTSYCTFEIGAETSAFASGDWASPSPLMNSPEINPAII
jgi:hypothetical protein